MLLVPYVGQLLRVSWLLFWDRRVFPLLKILPLAAFVYVLSPIDLLRDYVLGIGQVDDVIVTLVLLTVFVAVSPRKVVHEHIHGRYGGDDDDPDAIDGKYRYIDRE
jgi:uncharacterized membrane protein YkvA (DUF1232 family)